MNQLLIPSGEIEFHGNLEQLLQAIIRVDGILMADQQFRCALAYRRSTPGLNISIFRQRGLSLLYFKFQGRYEPTANGFRICYRVTPSLMGILLLIFPFYAAYAGYVQFAPQGTGWYGLLFGFALAAVVFPLLFWLRKRCARRFLDAFRS